MRSGTFAIAGRRIGRGEPPYVIAEMSGNHNGDVRGALKLIEAAKEAGADAVKLQTYTADTITLDHDGPEFRVGGGTLWDGQTLHELYSKAYTPWEWHAELFAHGRKIGIAVFSSPFDPTAVDFLEKLEPPAYKIASFELIDHGLIAKVARTGRPIIMSTGMATLGEIEEAVAAARQAGAKELALLHCISGYPTPAAEANLATMPHLAATFGVPTGLSDHTLGLAVPLAATALGACLIEKHFTLSRADGGPDADFSLEREELVALVREVRAAHAALGHVSYDLEPSEQKSRVFRRSLYAVRDIAEGETLTSDNVRSIRPGLGLAPKHLPAVLGRKARNAIPRGSPLDWSLVT